MRKTKVRAGATLIIAVALGYLSFQLSWIYFTQAQLWLHGFTDKGFYPYAYGAGAAGLAITLVVGWVTRPKDTQPQNTIPKKERLKLENYWQLLKKTGTTEQMEEFKREHPQFFGLTNAEMAEQPNSSFSLSPKNAPASPPTPEPEVSQNGKEIIIKIKPETLTHPPQASPKSDNNGFDNDFNKQMEKIYLDAARSGKIENLTISRKDGKFVLPETFTVKIGNVQEKPSEPIQPEKNAALRRVKA